MFLGWFKLTNVVDMDSLQKKTFDETSTFNVYGILDIDDEYVISSIRLEQVSGQPNLSLFNSSISLNEEEFLSEIVANKTKMMFVHNGLKYELQEV